MWKKEHQVGIIATDRRYTLMVSSLSLSQKYSHFFTPSLAFSHPPSSSLSLSKKSGNIETSVSIFPLFHLPSSLSLSQNIPTFSHPLSLFSHPPSSSLSLSQKRVGILRHPSQYSHFFTPSTSSLSLKFPPTFSPPLSRFSPPPEDSLSLKFRLIVVWYMPMFKTFRYW